MRGILFIATIVALTQSAPQTPAATAADPVTVIVDALRTHRVVALPDPHGNQQAHALLLKLVRDRRITAAVNDIVVTFANARYQDVVDRFVRGEAVALPTVRQAWRETTAPNLSGELPTHEEFFLAVRELNAPLKLNQRLRVLLADPPIEWEQVMSRADYAKARDQHASFAAGLIQREVVDNRRRALLVAGFPELQRANAEVNYDMREARSHTIVSALEQRAKERVFVVWSAGPETLAKLQDISTWPAPAMALVRNTRLGEADFQHYWAPPRVAIVDEKVAPVPREQWLAKRADQQFDAVLYLGATSTEIPLSRDICTDKAALQLRLQRMTAAEIPKPEIERLRTHCEKKARPRPATAILPYSSAW